MAKLQVHIFTVGIHFYSAHSQPLPGPLLKKRTGSEHSLLCISLHTHCKDSMWLSSLIYVFWVSRRSGCLITGAYFGGTWRWTSRKIIFVPTQSTNLYFSCHISSSSLQGIIASSTRDRKLGIWVRLHKQTQCLPAYERLKEEITNYRQEAVGTRLEVNRHTNNMSAMIKSVNLNRCHF